MNHLARLDRISSLVVSEIARGHLKVQLHAHTSVDTDYARPGSLPQIAS
jgi:hypothetical protein